jgi:hypothetical protein
VVALDGAGAGLASAKGALERRAKKWNPVFRETGATTIESTASGDRDLSPDAVGRKSLVF